jgi:hypothetical protein
MSRIKGFEFLVEIVGDDKKKEVCGIVIYTKVSTGQPA